VAIKKVDSRSQVSPRSPTGRKTKLLFTVR
jgi:hypothetical protein